MGYFVLKIWIFQRQQKKNYSNFTKTAKKSSLLKQSRPKVFFNEQITFTAVKMYYSTKKKLQNSTLELRIYCLSIFVDGN